MDYKSNLNMINFVCFGTDNCENLLDVFYKHLISSCEESFFLHYYSINYKSSIVGDNLIIHPININLGFKRGNFYKPYVLLKSLMEIPDNNFVYLDLDIVITKHFNINELFKKIDSSSTPLSPNHFWEHPYKIINGAKTQNAENLSKLFNINIFNKYVQNCVIVYNKKHFQFMWDWASLTNDKEILNMVFGDEELYNFLLWKYEQSNTLGYLCVTSGTLNIEDIKEGYELYQNDKFDKSLFIVQNNYCQNIILKDIMFFHGIK